MRTVVAVVVAMVLAGCSSAPQISPEPYAGPAVSIDSTGPKHVVVVTAPSSGWTLNPDSTQRQFEFTQVFVSITGPNQAYMQAQSLIALHLESSVASTDPIVVYARVVDFGKTAERVPFRRAAAAERVKPAGRR